MKQFLVGLLLIFSLSVQAQDIKEYVTQHTAVINTIDPDTVNYNDLEVLGNAIGDARIVMLGEQDHGDAPTFLAKTRIIQYLHEKKGFNVLAFESDFFGLNEGWDRLNKTTAMVDTFLLRNIFPIWTFCDACNKLFYDYIPATQNTDHPLQVSGFDMQLVLNYSWKHLAQQADSVFRYYNLPITHDSNYTTEVIPLIDSLKKYKMNDASQYSKQLQYLFTIKEQLGKKLPPTDFWMMVIDNLIASSMDYSNLKKYVKSFNTRDEQMAKNLLWLATNKYPNEKIIVWAHNVHISKNAGHYKHLYINRMEYMGSVFDTLKPPSLKTYVLGFTSYSGTAGRITAKTYKLFPPRDNGFENWMPELANFAFVDFNAFNNSYPDNEAFFLMKGQHHTGSIKAPWNYIYNGMFFIRNMYPCKQQSFIPTPSTKQ